MKFPPLLVDLPPLATVDALGFVRMPWWLEWAGDQPDVSGRRVPTLVAAERIHEHWPNLARRLALEEGEC